MAQTTADPTTGGYHERPPAQPLSTSLACVWGSRHDGPPRIKSIVPDGCIDIIWSSHDDALHVAGPDTVPFAATLRPAEEFAAVRFLPGAAVAALGIPASALVDDRVGLEHLWGRDAVRLAEQVADASDRPRALEALVTHRILGAGPPDRTAARVVGALVAGFSVHGLAAELGYSERHLLRRCREMFGYGPQTLHRILRFQRALAMIDDGMTLADVAYRSGYADQAHLSREVRRLAGVPPSARAGTRALRPGAPRAS